MKFLSGKFIKRYLFDKVYSHVVKKPEITLIVGPRQAGKTTLMKLVEKRLRDEGEKTIFFNLDVESHKRYFESQEIFLRKLKLELGNQHSYVFIDEIQRKENAGSFLKGIYDLETPYMIIASGSGSLELKEKIHESLVGRKRIFELNTVNFREFVNFKTDYRYEHKLEDFFKIEGGESLLKEYLLYGGYPRVILEELGEEKFLIIDEIFSSYIERDIRVLLGVDKISEYAHLIRVLAASVGRPLRLNEVASSVGITFPTLKKFLYYAEKTFVIFGISPFYTNKLKEISKSKVYYFNDLGLRNYAIGVFGNENALDGFLFQNFIALELNEVLSFSPYSLYFWRTKEKAEVDFVVEPGPIPIEVKYSEIKVPKVSRSMRSFINKYHPRWAFVVNLKLEDSVKIGETEVIFLPFYRLEELKKYLGN